MQNREAQEKRADGWVRLRDWPIQKSPKKKATQGWFCVVVVFGFLTKRKLVKMYKQPEKFWDQRPIAPSNWSESG